MLSILAMLFTSAARVCVLQHFLLDPEAKSYQREIERKTGQPIRAVQREVSRLTEIGLLTRSESGNRVYYQINPGFPLLDELTMLFQSASGAAEASRDNASAKTMHEASISGEPFPWLAPGADAPLPPSLRELQVGGEWDWAY